MSLFSRKPKAKKAGLEHIPAPAPEIALAVVLPEWANHPNRVPFEGVLTLVDEPSDKAPSGARGHRVILSRAAAVAALPSLLGMAVGYKSGWDGHNARQRCGVILRASLSGNRLVVGGYMLCRDYPEIYQRAAEGDLGMSYELQDAHIEEMGLAVWTIERAIFVGAAVLDREKAAYRRTSFTLQPEPPPKRQAKKTATMRTTGQPLSITSVPEET